MSYSFALIEENDVIGDSVETLLTRRFSSAFFCRIPANHFRASISNGAWRDYDFVLVDCSDSFDKSAFYTYSIKQRSPNCSVLLLSGNDEVKLRSLEVDADGYHHLGDSWGSLGARIEDLIGLRKNLSTTPFNVEGWKLIEVLHDGENSVVYRAVNRDGLQSAVKRFKYDLTMVSQISRDKFLRDLDSFSNINTPKLVKIYDSGISDHAFYQVMELMEQGSLEDNLRAHERLPLSHALTWFFEIVHALHIVHVAGLMHRDLKPANIMLRDDGSLALNDYGSATSLLIESGVIGVNEIHCTPFYVSPERAMDEPCGVASDIYSLGIIFYELLMGEKPYNGSTEMELMMQHVLAPIPRLSGEYAIFQSLLDKMLAKEVDQRLQRAIDVGSYLSG